MSLASMPIQISTQVGPGSVTAEQSQHKITPIRRFSAESNTVPTTYAPPVLNPNIHNLDNSIERSVSRFDMSSFFRMNHDYFYDNLDYFKFVYK